MKHFIFSLLLFCFCSLQVSAEEEFLRPEEAFTISKVKVVEGQDAQHQLQVTWKIADGYYMYKNKVSFSSENKKINLGQPALPKGEEKDDEFFGRIEIFKKQFTATVPVSSELVKQDLQITAKTQGCAEAGICYPPFRQKVNFTLPKSQNVAAVNPSQVLGAMVSDGNSAGGFGDEEEFLAPDDAFKLNVGVNPDGKLIADWQVADEYYLYKNKFKFELLGKPEVSLGDINLPKGKMKTDDILGTYEVYYKQIEAEIPVIGNIDKSKPLDMKITFQGCAEAGICYPLMKKNLSINVADLKSAKNGGPKGPSSQVKKVSKQVTAQASAAIAAMPESEQDALASYLKKGNAALILLTFFGLGLALAFTPCVFPMIPILSGIIAGQGDNINTRKAFAMSVVYVLAMAVTYTIAGVIAGLSGENIQIWFQNPWVLSSFAVVFVLLSLSMFGFYELQLPSSLQSKMTELSNKQKGGEYSGVAVMGFLSALIVGPCVAPPLMGALIYISQTGDPFIGGGALFAMSIGMGLPLIAIGTSAGKFLPRAGVWMDNVKAGFGVLMLAVAIWMMERVLPAGAVMGLWATLLIFSAVYLGAFTPITETTTGWGKFRKSAAIVVFLYGISLIIGTLAGNHDMFQPLKGLGGGNVSASVAAESHVQFQRVKNVSELEASIAQANASGKPVLLDFYADWCISCKEMEKFTFSDPQVSKTMGNFVLLQADVTDDNQENADLLKYYNLFGPPAIIFYTAQGQEYKNFRVVGYKEAGEFNAHLNQFLQL